MARQVNKEKKEQNSEQPWYRSPKLRPVWIALSVIFVCGLTGFIFRTPITNALSAAHRWVFSTFGIGILPTIAWGAVFVWALAKRRWSWFKKVNLWAGSLILLILIHGVLSFFIPGQGFLTHFALAEDGSLGGEIGRWLKGPALWIGVFQIFGVFLLAAWVTAPSFMKKVSLWLWDMLGIVWQGMKGLAGSVTSGLRKIYHFEPRRRFIENKDQQKVRDNAKPSQGLVSRAAAITGLDKSVFNPKRGEPAEKLEKPDLKRSPFNGPHGEKSSVPEVSEDIEDEDMGFEEEDGEEEKQDTEDTAGLKDHEVPNPVKSMAGAKDGVDEEKDAPVEEVLKAAGALKYQPSKAIIDANNKPWKLPPKNILTNAPVQGISKSAMDNTAESIKKTLADYGVEVEIGQVKPGPTVTVYGLIPGWVRKYKQVPLVDDRGRPKLDDSHKPIMSKVEMKTRVRVDTILAREKDLALALKTPSIRIETPVLGQSLVGIEVPNPNPEMVTLRSVMESSEFKELTNNARLPIPLGKSTGGTTAVVDLTKAPHLLVAGATGMGKSVFINSIISCLIMERSPADIRLLLIDPKRVELTPYNGIPHLLTPVVVETDQVVGLLKGMIREMFNRYRRFEEMGVRNIQGFNRKMTEKMPYLIVAVDELADLMMSAAFDVEQSLCRLAQLGRATGIHLIVATQRPSVDVVTGLIKANFPSRVSFGVTSQIDSRTILDSAGAEKLLGRGDMLYLSQDASRPERIQGAFISDREIEDLVVFWHSTPWRPLPEVILKPVEEDLGIDGQEENEDSRDELMDKAIELARNYSKISTSLLQRRLRIGYPRAARLMDQLEDAGIVGPGDGSKSRDVIIT